MCIIIIYMLVNVKLKLIRVYLKCKSTYIIVP